MLKVFKFKMQALRPVLNTRRKTLGENNVMTYISCELFLNTAVFSMIVLWACTRSPRGRFKNKTFWRNFGSGLSLVPFTILVRTFYGDLHFALFPCYWKRTRCHLCATCLTSSEALYCTWEAQKATVKEMATLEKYRRTLNNFRSILQKPYDSYAKSR